MGEYISPTQAMKSKALQREENRRTERQEAFNEIVEICSQASSVEEAYITVCDNYFEYKKEFDDAWRYAQARKEADVMRQIRERAMAVEWRPWQYALEHYLLNNIDDRRVDCVLDPTGGTGKSFFIQQYIGRHPNTAVEIMQGKSENMMAQIANANFAVKVAFLDLTRFQQENANLTVVETLKNAVVHNHKYKVFTKHYLHAPHVVVMTNQELEWRHMTLDRWHIWEMMPNTETGFRERTMTKDNIPDPDSNAPNFNNPGDREAAQEKLQNRFDKANKRKAVTEAEFIPCDKKPKTDTE
jgi:hypothetical protein